MEPARLAPQDGTSTKIKHVSPSATYATPGTKSPDNASPATTDQLLRTETVSLMSILVLSPKVISFVRFGLEKFAKNALTEVSSIKMDFVLQSALNAIPLTKLQETALLASLDMI